MMLSKYALCIYIFVLNTPTYISAQTILFIAVDQQKHE